MMMLVLKRCNLWDIVSGDEPACYAWTIGMPLTACLCVVAFIIQIWTDWIVGYHSWTPWFCCPVVLASSDGGLLMHWMGLCTNTYNLSTYM
jgi:hypothetical protein